MGTATLVNDAVTQDVTVDSATYVLIGREVEKDGKTEKQGQFMTEKGAEKFLADEANKKEGWIELARQTFEIPVAQTLSGISQIVPSEKEAVKLFERGKSNKAYQIIRSRMLEQDENGDFVFQPIEGAVSLKAEVAEETASRATTPEAKMEKLLEGVDQDTALALIQKLQARLQAQAAGK